MARRLPPKRFLPAGKLQRSLQNGENVRLGQRRPRLVQPLVFGDVVRHLGQAALVDADLAQVHRHTERLKQGIDRTNGLLCNLRLGQCRVNAENVDTEADKPFDGVVV